MLNRIINRETVLYILFGVMTTIVNFGSYWIFDRLLGQNYYLISNIFSFFFATIFAFITNKIFVFESKSWKWQMVMREVLSFISARIGTFIFVEELGLWILVRFFGVNRICFPWGNGAFLAKIGLAFFAVLLNYILSKFFVFRKNN